MLVRELTSRLSFARIVGIRTNAYENGGCADFFRDMFWIGMEEWVKMIIYLK